MRRERQIAWVLNVPGGAWQAMVTHGVSMHDKSPLLHVHVCQHVPGTMRLPLCTHLPQGFLVEWDPQRRVHSASHNSWCSLQCYRHLDPLHPQKHFPLKLVCSLLWHSEGLSCHCLHTYYKLYMLKVERNWMDSLQESVTIYYYTVLYTVILHKERKVAQRSYIWYTYSFKLQAIKV